MKDLPWIERLWERARQRPKLFLVVNTLFWIGLAVLLLTSPVRLVVGGSLLALLMGAYLVYAGVSSRITRGMAYPGLARSLSLSMGLVAVAGGVAGLVAFTRSGGPWVVDRSPVAVNPSELVTHAVCGGFLLLACVLSGVIHHLLAAREARCQAEARREGFVFPIPPLFRAPAVLMLLLVVPIDVFVFIASLNPERTTISRQAGCLLPLLLLPAVALSIFLLLRYQGMVVLTRDGLILQRLGRRRRLPYAGITGLRRGSGLARGLEVWGEGGRIRIPATVRHRPRLYETLLARVPEACRRAVQVRQQEQARPSGGARDDSLPLQLSIPARDWGFRLAGILLLGLIYLAIALFPLWDILADGGGPAEIGGAAVAILVVFLLVSALFVPAVAFVARSLWTRRGPFGIDQPSGLELGADAIRFRFPLRPWQRRPVGGLVRLDAQASRVPLRARVDGVVVKEQIERYVLILRFSDDRLLVIDEERAGQWGLSIEELAALIRRLYPHVEAG